VDELIVDVGRWFLGQGALGIMLLGSIYFNVQMVKKLLDVVQSNTMAFARLEKVIEGLK
jgi:hypothetical protein